MTFTVKFDTNNAAFGEWPEVEIAAILRAIADRVEAGVDCSHYQTILDSNGNDVGRFAWKASR